MHELNKKNESQQIEHVLSFGPDIKYVDNPSLVVQLASLNSSGFNIQHIQLPSVEAIKYALVIENLTLDIIKCVVVNSPSKLLPLPIQKLTINGTLLLCHQKQIPHSHIQRKFIKEIVAASPINQLSTPITIFKKGDKVKLTQSALKQVGIVPEGRENNKTAYVTHTYDHDKVVVNHDLRGLLYWNQDDLIIAK